MAGYKGHLTGATLFGLGYVAVLGYAFSIDAAYRQFSTLEQVGYPLILLVLALLFGLWPDVDTNSKGQRVFYSIFFVTDLFLIVTEQFRAAAYLGLVALLPVLSRHRGRCCSFRRPCSFCRTCTCRSVRSSACRSTGRPWWAT
jgi:hypothetical protein